MVHYLKSGIVEQTMRPSLDANLSCGWETSASMMVRNRNG